MSTWLRQLFGNNQSTSELGQERSQTPIYTPPPSGHPPVVQRPERSAPRKKVRMTHTLDPEQTSSIRVRGSNISAKRHIDENYDERPLFKKPRIYEEEILQTPTCDKEKDDVVEIVRSPTKRRMSPSAAGEYHLTKRPRLALAVDASPKSTTTGTEYATAEDEIQTQATSMCSNDEHEFTSSETAGVVCTGLGHATNTIRTSVSTP